MNSDEFKLTGGIDASPTAFHNAMWTKLPFLTIEDLILLGRNARKNPGGESASQAILDCFNHHGVPGLRMIVRAFLRDSALNRWKGIKAAEAKKHLRKFANDY
jgi:hypothetical protein